jgi:hypothetical protein
MGDVKHPPRLFINFLGGEQGPKDMRWYAAWETRTNSIQTEVMAASEHQALVRAEYDERCRLQAQINKLEHDAFLKDYEIAELKDRLERNNAANAELVASCNRAFSSQESKLKRAESALERVLVNFKLAISANPVRDATETIMEAEQALSQIRNQDTTNLDHAEKLSEGEM